MKLDELLRSDEEAATLFHHLPPQIQAELRYVGDEIDSVATLRDRAIHVIHRDGPFYREAWDDGTKLDPELKARWTQEHQA